MSGRSGLDTDGFLKSYQRVEVHSLVSSATALRSSPHSICCLSNLRPGAVVISSFPRHSLSLCSQKSLSPSPSVLSASTHCPSRSPVSLISPMSPTVCYHDPTRTLKLPINSWPISPPMAIPCLYGSFTVHQYDAPQTLKHKQTGRWLFLGYPTHPPRL